MAFSFTVEDGTGIEGANAYCTVSFADDHHEGRGNTKWTDASVTPAVKEAAIVRATDHVEKRFGHRFVGTRSSQDQGLSWPRDDAYDRSGFERDEEVPIEVQRAVAEYALRALEYHELDPDPPLPVPQQDHRVDEEGGSDVAAGPIASETKTVGPITKSVTYETNSRVRVTVGPLTRYPGADLLLKPIIRKGGRVVRA